MQNFKNHRRYVPLFHMGLLGLCLAIIVGAAINLYHAWQTEACGTAALLLLIGIALLLVSFFARTFALTAHNKAIRAEENLRHFVLTGKLLPANVKMGQIVALRFAPDDEFVSLVSHALENNWNNKTIKMAIKNWKADYNRV